MAAVANRRESPENQWKTKKLYGGFVKKTILNRGGRTI